MSRTMGIPGDVIMSQDITPFADDWYITDKIKQVWDRGITGKGVKFAVNDTGGTDNHPKLKPPLQRLSAIRGENGVDSNGHGTACSYIASTVAPDADYITIQVLGDNGSGSTAGINRAYGMAAEEDCDFVNGSYGDNGGPPIREDIDAIDESYDLGMSLVNIAAGNAGFNGRTNTIGRPASYENTGCTGSTDRNNQISGYSSGGRQLDWACFGQDMTYANPRGGFSRGSGTSFATPYFVGILCLVQQARREVGLPDLHGVTEWRDFFIAEDMLRDAGRPGEDDSFGIGIPDIEKMLDWILKVTPENL